MFLRFTKGAFDENNVRKLRKCVLLGDALVMEYGNEIVGCAKLHNETDKCMDYDVVVAGGCELGADTIARYIKNMIGKSNKFSINPSTKKRKYFVDVVDCVTLPLKANIVFTSK